MLSLRSVSAGYGSFRALFDVSLEVAAGEAIGVVGPNGAGKSTLMRVISGMLRASSGELSFEGRSLTRLPAHRIVEAGIAHVPEHRRLFAKLTVEENLRIGAFLPQARRHYAERSEWVYALFPRLLERRRQLAGTLSGGEQQMVAIGRALMSKPKMLLMDEPSAGLARSRRRDRLSRSFVASGERASPYHRRAKPPASARRRRSRLSPRSRPHPAFRKFRRAQARPGDPPSLHGIIEGDGHLPP